MLAYTVPPEAIGSTVGVIAVAVVYGLVQTARVRERVAKIEEWIRQEERRQR